MQLATRLNLIPRLTMSGVVPLHPPYAFVLWRGTFTLSAKTGINLSRKLRIQKVSILSAHETPE